MSDHYIARLPTGSQDIALAVPKIHQYFREKLHLKDKDLDVGIPVTRWPSNGNPPQQKVEGVDGKVSDQEILQEAFKRLEQISLGRSNFSSELCGQTEKNFFCFYKDNVPFFPPWILDDGNSKTQEDAGLRTRIDEIVRRAHQSVSEMGLKPGNDIYNTYMTNHLLKAMRMRRDKGGLGLLYDSNSRHRRRDGVETYNEGIGDCNSFSYLFYAMARRAGLNPTFIDVLNRKNKQTGQIQKMAHVAVAVRLDPQKPSVLTPVDPSDGTWMDERYQWLPLTPLEMAANYLRNVAFTEVNIPRNFSREQVIAWQESLIREAIFFAPLNFEIQSAAVHFYLNLKKEDRFAFPHHRLARELNPRLRYFWIK
jgi:hypothetical protein